MKKTAYLLVSVLAASLFTACQRTTTSPTRSTGTDAATIASGGNQTPDRSGQQPVPPDRTPANAAANSPTIGAPTVTSTNTPTPVIDSHQTPMTQDTTNRNAAKGAAPNTQPGTIWNNSTQVGNQPVPNSTQSNQTTPANRNGVNDIPATQPRQDATTASGGLTGTPAATSATTTSNAQKLTDVSRQIDEVDAEMRNNPTESRKNELNKKRQKLVKQLNKLQGSGKTKPTGTSEQ